MEFIFAKHSTLKDPINIYLRRIFESGIYDFLFKKYQMTNRTYFEASIYSTDFIAIHLVDIQTAFYILLGGYALSFLAFLAEILMNGRKKNNLKVINIKDVKENSLKGYVNYYVRLD
ncbi:hypothetical protein Avbf_10398 [Armadillidium vulgare]|nr:hypothetical protein Avbf_10398 [Armadillidium vulgare]